jgi:hypothetical protein
MPLSTTGTGLYHAKRRKRNWGALHASLLKSRRWTDGIEILHCNNKEHPTNSEFYSILYAKTVP